MKAQELRIGNWIRKTGNEGTILNGFVTGLEKNKIDSNLNDDFLMDDNFEGIPLTEEWLLKLGFNSTYAKDCFQIALGELSLHFIYVTLMNDGDNILTIGDQYSTNKHLTVFIRPLAQYVHQLQNLFFALTGEELELKS